MDRRRAKWVISAGRKCHQTLGGHTYYPIGGGKTIHDYEDWGFTKEDAQFIVKCLNERDKARAESAEGEK